MHSKSIVLVAIENVGCKELVHRFVLFAPNPLRTVNVALYAEVIAAFAVDCIAPLVIVARELFVP